MHASCGYVPGACCWLSRSARRRRAPRRARQVYESACAACHGIDGRGRPAAMSDYPVAAPDFTDCSFATREPDADWLAVSHAGGPARGFSRLMPAFGDALSRTQLADALRHIRTFCRSDAWPRGELNLPRALVTTKAYPEDEAVLTVTADGTRSRTPSSMNAASVRATRWNWSFPWRWRIEAKAIGPVASAISRFAFKRTLLHSLRRGSIFSGAVEVVVPTGSTERGIGDGATVFEPFVAFGQILPSDAFVQAQVGGGFPVGGDQPREAFWRAVAGRTFTQGEFGRAWSPMLEILGAREFSTAPASTLWDVVPQMQVTLSRRQHIMLNAGIRIPLNERADRSTQLMVYLLWDWFDGGFFSGW